MNLEARVEKFPIRGGFQTAHGSKNEAVVIAVEAFEDGLVGRGESVAYPAYNESPTNVLLEILSFDGNLEGVQSRAARNAIDCATWDLKAKRAGKRVWDLLGLEVSPVEIGTTVDLRAKAAMQPDGAFAKIKLTSPVDLSAVKRVREHWPELEILVDANESWSVEDYDKAVPELAKLRVALIEQPFARGSDEALKDLSRPIPVCADESCHDTESLERLVGLYDAVNIKLDKTGGLTEALAVKEKARELGFKVMVGCMVATSLSIAPAWVLAQGVEWADLDGGVLLEKDREHALEYKDGLLSAPAPELWG